MRMNSRSPAPSRRNRGPLPDRGLMTCRTTDSSPLAVPFSSRAATWAVSVAVTRSSGMSGSSLRVLQLCAHLLHHVFHHRAVIEARLPSPFRAGSAVVQPVGPRVCDALTDGIHIVIDGEAGNLFRDQTGEPPRCNLHGCDVERV